MTALSSPALRAGLFTWAARARKQRSLTGSAKRNYDCPNNNQTAKTHTAIRAGREPVMGAKKIEEALRK